ncbi:MFS transporter [Streptomyces zagrosensis]|uniref:EmrB/QacA subfamily drug resistance transporter n=1 Tax=Streptomyces zagrosensis TaxID=1042984 RepID=A0A7W9QHP3_9ACTN|nr:MFS transporter [Streptomyces zagrosensis]MBB5940174.1 EmrB/QacA subfamily drug resistance transporter [Streptomyces zagrosensis]
MSGHTVQLRALPPRNKPGLTLLAALLGLFIALLDVTVVTVAMPTIGTDLHATFDDLEWVANAYMLALAVFIVTAGRLGDLYGQRMIYVVGVVVFLAGSALCAGAGEITLFGWDHITTLHIGRVIQGVGGAVVLPLTLAIIYSSFEGEKRAKGMMLWGAVGGLATALGPLIGGVLVDHAGWEWIFLINVPIGAIVIFATLAGMGADERPAAGTERSLDLPGLGLLSTSLLCINLALINGNSWGWTSAKVLLLFAGGALLLLGFLFVESRSRAPIIDLGWFRRPSFGGSIATSFLMGAGMFSVIFYLSIYLQEGLRLSAQETGVRLLPLTLCLVVGAPVGGRIVAKAGVRKALTLAMTLMAIGIALYTLADPNGDSGSWTNLLPGMLLTGLALGIAMPVASELTIASAPQDQVGVSASAGTMVRQVGNAVGIAIMGALMSNSTDTVVDKLRAAAKDKPLTEDIANDIRQRAVTEGIENGVWYAAAVTLLAAVMVAVFVRDRQPASPTPPPPARPDDTMRLSKLPSA